MSAVLDYVGIDGAENILDSHCRDTLVGPASVIDRLRVSLHIRGDKNFLYAGTGR